jgi:hydroxymethylglutaryl-CoA lyase
MADYVRITDVAPRDGLQNEPGVIPTAEKVRLVELLCATGVDEVEVTSFVSPKWVPQLGDAEAVCEALWTGEVGKDSARRVELSALVPNEKGLEAFERVNARSQSPGKLLDKVSVFTAASETFSRKNTNASIAESIERHGLVRDRMFRMRPAPALRAYISCVIACPFEGPIEPQRVADVAEQVWTTLLPDELDLGDTIGAGTPRSVAAMLGAVIERSKHWRTNGRPATDCLVLHLHDTFGRAAACVKAALDMGIRSFDGSVAGLGGCPYASTPGKLAPGNISTRTLVDTIHAAGCRTGVDLKKLDEAAIFAKRIVAEARARAAAQGA